MAKFEFRTLRVTPQKLQEKLEPLGEQGFQVVSTDVASNKIVVILQKEKTAGRPKKKK